MDDILNSAKETLKKLVAIKSVDGEPSADMPFGEGVYNALQFMLKTGEKLNFKPINYDNYIGELCAFYSENKIGKEDVGVLVHLDVVPEGNGWTMPAFEGIEKDGKIYGRGVMDNKAPAVACLYAIKMLMNENFKANKTVRLILGCNEENGWRCIDHFKEVATSPSVSISPDADFPVIYAEKGIANFKFKIPYKSSVILNIEGGERANMVCDRCDITIKEDNEKISARAKALGLELENGKIIARGISAHASLYENGINAIYKALYLINDSVAHDIINKFFLDKFGLEKLCDHSGNLTMSPDIISYDGENIYLTIDVRYPATLPFETLKEKLNKFGFSYEITHHHTPITFEKDSPLVLSLCNIYNGVMGTDYKPIAIGGGTYARAFNNAIAFGPKHPNENDVFHKSDEFIEIDNFNLLIKIYYEAIKYLAS